MTATVIRFPVERRAAPVPGPAAESDVADAWAVQAHSVLDLAERLVDQQPTEVVALCRQAFELLAAAEDDIDDDVSVHLLADRLGALHRRACEQSNAGAGELADWLAAAWHRCPALTRHFVAGAAHPAGRGRPMSAAIADARRRHPTARRAATSTRTAG